MNKLVQSLEKLAGALALDAQFRQDFQADKRGAIQKFNKEFAPRYRQKPLELSTEELRLIDSIQFNSVEEFISLLAVITSSEYVTGFQRYNGQVSSI